MTTPKRCEVCGLPPCNLWMTGCEGHCHCNGHPSPPPRPDEWETTADEIQKIVDAWFSTVEEMRKFKEGFLYQPKIQPTIDVKAFLLSYGKEREREMWLKCKDAVEQKKILEGTEHELFLLRWKHEALSALDALNPDNSSPDEGREGRV